VIGRTLHATCRQTWRWLQRITTPAVAVTLVQAAAGSPGHPKGRAANVAETRRVGVAGATFVADDHWLSAPMTLNVIETKYLNAKRQVAPIALVSLNPVISAEELLGS